MRLDEYKVRRHVARTRLFGFTDRL
jgi:hypothetical protein